MTRMSDVQGVASARTNSVRHVGAFAVRAAPAAAAAAAAADSMEPLGTRLPLFLVSAAEAEQPRL
jgi:hypothetical protein